MNKTVENHHQQKKFSAFWERMALTYPLPFDEKNLTDTRRVFSIVKNRGVDFTGAAVLDIGCGTGIYTLPMANEAETATGLDDSEVMLERMHEVVSSHRIKNVETIKASWRNLDIDVENFRKVFDIVWISMSPAVQTVNDFKKMEACAKKWCVYIGWGRKRENDLMKEVFHLHGLNFGPPPGVAAALKILSKWERNPSIDYFETSWDWEGTTADALENLAGFVEMQGKQPNYNLIENVLSRYEINGRICHTTEVKEGIMVWRVV